MTSPTLSSRSRRLKANALAIKNATADGNRRAIYSVEGITGLRLYIEPTNSRSWQFEYNIDGKRYRVHIGDAAVVSLSDARNRATELRRAVQLGGNPHAEKIALRADEAREQFTFADLFRRWQKAHQHLKGLKERVRALESDALPTMGERPVAEITKRDVIDVIDRIADRGARVHADHIAAYLSAIFNWGVDEELCELNPAYRIRKRGNSKPRERVLTDEEIVALWRAFSGDDAKIGDVADLTLRALKLAFLTGQRRGELIAAKIDEFDHQKALWTLPGERTKNSRTHYLPVPPMTLALVVETAKAYGDYGNGFLFPASSFTAATPHIHARSVSKALENICGKLQIEGVSLHCFRRTLATRLGDLGTSGDVIARILNHSPQDVTSRHYNHAKMLSQMRDALEAWEAEIQRLSGHTADCVTENRT